MRLKVLGAGAGGGLPQWNCACRNCAAARQGRLPAMTQSSVAVSAGEGWAILNASPDIRAQLQATPELHPRGPRDSPVSAVLLTNGDVDHVAGLLTLRESHPFRLISTSGVLDELDANPIFGVVNPDLVPRIRASLEAPFELLPGLVATLFSVPGKVALWLEGDRVETAVEGEQTVGVELRANGRRALVIPGCAAVPPSLVARMEGAELLLFDGTAWTDDEMLAAGLGRKTAARMGHMPMHGPRGSIAALEAAAVRRRVFVHVNNTNPALDPDGPERRTLEAAGWELAQDGMEIAL